MVRVYELPVTNTGRNLVETMEKSCEIALKQKRITIEDARLFVLLVREGVILIEEELKK